MNWISVEKELPEDGKRVIFSWLNESHYRGTSIGYYASFLGLRAEDQWDGFGELDADYFDYKDTDTDFEDPYLPEGWYEEGAEGEYCYPQSNVTHWMNLPLSPRQE
jgi:hypothetical protein